MTARRFRAALPALAFAMLGTAAMAAPPPPACPSGVPEGVGCGEASLRSATAGTYALDASHASVIAKVSHLGYSNSVFRFGKVSGTLTWDPAAPAKSKLSVSVDPASIETPVEGFAKELAGDKFLNAAAFPQATFVSTAFRPKGATAGQVDGTLTLMGKSRPVTFDVKLVGAGTGFFGKPRLGVEARTAIQPQDYGLAPVFNRPIELVVDVEFERQS